MTCRGILLLMLSWPCGCKAGGESFIDLYLGPNSVEENDLKVERSAGATRVSLEIDRGITIGGRAGRYFDFGAPIQPGASFDASYGYFEIEDDAASAVILSLLGMLRWPLGVSEKHPQGLVRPYAAAGPSLAIVRFLNDLGVTGGEIHNEDTTLGLDVRGGISVAITQRLGAIVEYRFTSSRLEFDGVSGAERFKTEMDLVIHHVQFGISFRF